MFCYGKGGHVKMKLIYGIYSKLKNKKNAWIFMRKTCVLYTLVHDHVRIELC